MARKPTPKTGRKAWEAELKLLQRAIKKAHGIGLFIEEETITPPKRATQKQVAKLTAKRKEILQNVRQAKQAEKPSTKIRKSAAIETTSGIMPGVGDEEGKRQISAGMSVEARKARAKKAAETRKKKETALSPEERKALKEKRAKQFEKNIAGKRSKAAKKAAETRKKKEAALSPEERKALKEKRAKQLEKNLGREIPLPEIDTIPEVPPDLFPPQVADYPKIAEIVWFNYNRYLDDFEQRLVPERIKYADHLRARADTIKRLNDFIQDRIAQIGLNAFLLQVETDADEFQDNLLVVFFASEDSDAAFAADRIIEFLQGKVLTIEEAKALEAGYESIIDDSDLMPIDLELE